MDFEKDLEKITCEKCQGFGEVAVYQSCPECRECNGGRLGPCPVEKCGKGMKGFPGKDGRIISSVDICGTCNGHGHIFRHKNSRTCCSGVAL